MYNPRRRPVRMEPIEESRSREILTGRIPTDYTARQSLSKWTPQLNRLFYLPGSSEPSPLDWAKIMEGEQIRAVMHDESAKLRILDRTQQQLGCSCAVGLAGPWGSFSNMKSPQWNDSFFTLYGSDPSDYEARLFEMDLPNDVRSQPAMWRWLYQNSVAVPQGVYCLTSQLGPAGGAQLEDLPMYDSWEQGQLLIIVIFPRGDDYVVYRKIIRDEN